MTNAFCPCQLHKKYAVLWAANCSVDLETPEHNAFYQFWKFKFHFEYFPRNIRFLSFEGPSNYLHLIKNHRQTFSWPGKRPSSHLKIGKMGFGPNIKYLSEPFFTDFCCREGISCLILNKWPCTGKKQALHFQMSYGSQWDHFKNAIKSVKV